MLFRGLISWKALKQDIIITLTTKAELLTLEYITKESVTLLYFFKEI